MRRQKHPAQTPQRNVIGAPGGSVCGTGMAGSFGGRAAIGKVGEVRTAGVLARLCQGAGRRVLHDRRLPMGRSWFTGLWG